MGRIPGHYEWDDSVGTPGHRNDGSLHQNLYNEDGVLAGHARFVPGDDEGDSYENTFVTSDNRRESEETDELRIVIAAALLTFTVVGIKKVAPHVEKWWKEQAVPVISRHTKKIRTKGHTKHPEVELLEPVDKGQAVAKGDRRQTMSREEAVSRVIAGIAARAFSDEQFRMVKSARIVGVEEYTEIEQAIADFPPERLQSLILEMVKNPRLLEDASLANLASMVAPSYQLRERLPEPLQHENPGS